MGNHEPADALIYDHQSCVIIFTDKVEASLILVINLDLYVLIQVALSMENHQIALSGQSLEVPV